MKTLNQLAKKTTLAITLIVVTGGGYMNTAHAQLNTNEQNNADGKQVLVGVASGATMGALFAGPVGAVVGGVLGIMLGNDIVQESQQKQTEAQLLTSQHALAELNSELIAWQQKSMLQPVSQVQSRPQILPELTTSVQFRTGQSSIEALYSDQLSLIGDMLKSFEGLSIHVSGYADARGGNEENRILSLKRAKAVEAMLLTAGVKQQQISVSAMGEKGSKEYSNAKSVDAEHYFFDRKAIMTIAPTEKILTANY
jgi:sortase system peptidoglycan-associated protein